MDATRRGRERERDEQSPSMKASRSISRAYPPRSLTIEMLGQVGIWKCLPGGKDWRRKESGEGQFCESRTRRERGRDGPADKSCEYTRESSCSRGFEVRSELDGRRERRGVSDGRGRLRRGGRGERRGETNELLGSILFYRDVDAVYQ